MGKAFAGAFLGKIVAALFVAVCVALGFGPDKWAAMMLGAEPGLLARALFLLLAALTLVTLLLPYRKSISFSRTVSLRDGAKILYRAMRGTDTGMLFHGPTSEPTDDDVLMWTATHILEKVPLEVKKPPFRDTWEPLDPSEQRQLVVCIGANGLRRFDHDEVLYPDVRMKRKDLRRLIRQYRAEAKPVAA